MDPLASSDDQRRELWQLYEIAVEEYRFQVRLNWDRTKFFFTVNSALVAAAAALIKLGESEISYFFTALLFGTGALTSWIGKKAIQRSHEYYRNTRLKKTVIEDQLGLHKPLEGYQEPTTLAIGSTRGQQEHQRVLHGSDPKRNQLRPGTVISGLVGILAMFALTDLLGALISLYEFGSIALGQDLIHAALKRLCVI